MDSQTFAGHCDAIEGGEVYGWALNIGDTNQPVIVRVYLNGVLATEVLAGYYRPDVAAALACSGRNGFYIDVDSLCERAGKVEVDIRFPDDVRLLGSPFIHTVQEVRGKPAKPPLLFMHIPKTAGTAFREPVLSNYRQSEVAYLYGDPPGFPSTCIRDVPLGQRAHLRLVFGHFGYGIHCDMPQECAYAALIREPLNRVWAHYQHLARDRHPCVIEGERIRNIEDMLEDNRSVFLDNLYVRYFCGFEESVIPPGTINRDLYELARANACKPNVFIGHQDDLTSAYDLLAREQGWTTGLICPEVNGSPVQSKPAAGEAKAIEHFNRWDFQLYRDIISIKGEARNAIAGR